MHSFAYSGLLNQKSIEMLLNTTLFHYTCQWYRIFQGLDDISQGKNALELHLKFLSRRCFNTLHWVSHENYNGSNKRCAQPHRNENEAGLWVHEGCCSQEQDLSVLLLHSRDVSFHQTSCQRSAVTVKHFTSLKEYSGHFELMFYVKDWYDLVFQTWDVPINFFPSWFSIFVFTYTKCLQPVSKSCCSNFPVIYFAIMWMLVLIQEAKHTQTVHFISSK